MCSEWTGKLFAVCRSDSAREDFINSLQAILPRVNLAFFSLAGAALRLEDFHSTLLLAAALFTARLVAVYAGSLMGCVWSGAPVAHRKHMWQAMLTQVCAGNVGWCRCIECLSPILQCSFHDPVSVAVEL